jgi:hypothetical protein
MANSIPRKSRAITKSDTVYLKEIPSSLWVGGFGNICVLLVDDANSNDSANGTVFVGVQGVFPYQVKKVFSTLTTATNIVALQ